MARVHPLPAVFVPIQAGLESGAVTSSHARNISRSLLSHPGARTPQPLGIPCLPPPKEPRVQAALWIPTRSRTASEWTACAPDEPVLTRFQQNVV